MRTAILRPTWVLRHILFMDHRRGDSPSNGVRDISAKRRSKVRVINTASCRRCWNTSIRANFETATTVLGVNKFSTFRTRDLGYGPTGADSPRGHSKREQRPPVSNGQRKSQNAKSDGKRKPESEGRV